MKLIRSLILSSLVLIAGSIHATVKLSTIFSDNMILQRDQPIRIWGKADKMESIEIHFLDQIKKTKADKNGNWIITLSPQVHGGPYIMEIKGKNNRIKLKDILIGDLWLCSGQSNMEWVVKNVKDADIEISRANYPTIRSFNVKQSIGTEPKSDIEGTWQICSPATVADFSAVAYFFARKLNTELNIPIGIINSSWGGTDIETWISDEAFAKLPQHFSKRYDGAKIENIEKFLEENKSRKAAYYEAMTNEPGMSEKWFAPSTDISAWKTMRIPQMWETVLGELDGILWYRYNLTLPHEDAGKTAVIQLGAIDDNDITWINGSKIGETEGYAQNRMYSIPENILKEGVNSIIVKVTDYYGGGGFYGKPEDLYLEVNGKKYPLSGDWFYRESVTNKQFNFVEPSPNMQPSLLYNAMINPIIQLPIKGVIWYQGENNVSQAYDYRTLFPTMIKDWRTKWGYEYPFYWVQLANYLAKDEIPKESVWAELRMAQTEALRLPQTGQAVITDIGDANDIHPRNKQDVGNRLALLALNKDYGKSDIIYSGPTFKLTEIDGSNIIISYNNVGSGLFTPNKYGYIEGFSIAGADKKFKWAKAYIDGDKIVVYSDEINNPVAVRYSWGNNPDVNLFNREGLPAAPFKTDNWEWSTNSDNQ